MRHRRVNHEVVSLSAADGTSRACGARSGENLCEGEVDQALPAGGLVDGRGAEARELCVDVAHRAVTTWGRKRWKASA